MSHGHISSLINAGFELGKSMPVNWCVAAVSLCQFFQSVMNIAGYNSKDYHRLIRVHLNI